MANYHHFVTQQSQLKLSVIAIVAAKVLPSREIGRLPILSMQTVQSSTRSSTAPFKFSNLNSI